MLMVKAIIIFTTQPYPVTDGRAGENSYVFTGLNVSGLAAGFLIMSHIGDQRHRAPL